jgi:hypothetical protein
MFFARVEEGVADTLPAIFRQQHAFTEIDLKRRHFARIA